MVSNRGFFDHQPEEMAEWATAYDTLGIAGAAEAIREATKLMQKTDWAGDDPAEQLLDTIERRF
jgi:hypothetical protein